ncbi:MAG TPA: Crp/Fnr family transcriptional regulator [Burkholderiaceae bacterium]|nr:Crp/Fnr family transcriptional regulator [Burkholderiaceae bacterium]
MLPPELLQVLADRGRAVDFPRHAVIVREGDPADAFYLVLDGRVRVYASDDDGREAELNVLGPGEYFGELMLANRRRTASVRAQTRVRVGVVDRAEFEAVLAARPDLSFHVIQTLVARVRALTDGVRSLALMDVYGRVARLLLDSAVERDGQRVAPYMSQQLIAERVGASRPMVNRILRDLTEGRYIEVTRERIVLRRTLPKRW